MTKVLINVCSIREPDWKTVDSVFGTWMESNPDFQVAFGHEGDAQIDRARSIVATEFLENKDKFDVLLFIDDDLVWNPDAIKQVVMDSLENKTVVCGAYRIKNIKEHRLAIHYLNNDPIAIGPDSPGLIEVKYAGAGFMSIPRTVIEAVAKTLPKVDSGAGVKKDGTPNCLFYPMFQPFYPEGTYLSEDYAFCHRARELGFKIYIDGKLRLGHIGKCVYWPDCIE
jgi:hypothetical protein